MIERVYLKDYLIFEKIDLYFKKGLIVFTGASGAGKSVLIRGILSIFGFFDANAKVGEVVVDNDLDLEKLGIEKDDVYIFRQVKKNKNRYFINSNAVSKKNINQIAKSFIDYLSLREIKEFESEELLKVLDKMIKEKDYYVNLIKYKKKFKILKEKENRLFSINKTKDEIKEKIEFLKFELSRIEKISPSIKEFDKLIQIKKDFSKIEKIKEKALLASQIFEYENRVYEFLETIESEREFFTNTMDELRVKINEVNEKAEFLENINIEEVLERLSQLQELIIRFGSIQESLRYYEEKKRELQKLENLTFEKENLEKEIKIIKKELITLAESLSYKRKTLAKELENKLNFYLKKLYLPEATVKINKTSLNSFGFDEVKIVLNDIDIDNISTGELNRLRVAILASRLEYEEKRKTLFLDEIDSNLSGEESMSIAEVLSYISTKYQIFAISHQPQLASKANQHFLVAKKGNKSFIKELSLVERIEEISRIIGGKEKSQKAFEYAKELLKDVND